MDDGTAYEPLAMLLAYLRAASQAHWTAHWQSKGTPFYGDHLLMERIYKATVEEIDTLAEKLVAQYGAESVDLAEQLSIMSDLADEWAEQPDILTRSHAIEQTLQAVIANVREAMPDMSLGMDNFLAQLADDHETALYLLGQRLKGFPELPLDQDSAVRVAHRHVQGYQAFTWAGFHMAAGFTVDMLHKMLKQPTMYHMAEFLASATISLGNAVKTLGLAIPETRMPQIAHKMIILGDDIKTVISANKHKLNRPPEEFEA